MVNKFKKNDYHVIFCGYDIDHLKFLKKEIEEKNLSNYFTFFNYLEDEEIIAIYLNSHALVMPTFVGHYSLPLFESSILRYQLFLQRFIRREV